MKIRFFNNCCNFSLSNIQFTPGNSTITLGDVCEDYYKFGAEKLAQEINKITRFEKFSVDRVTPDYIRLKSVNTLGNMHYLKVSEV